MIEKISDLPENVLGFTASGAVTAKDYESVVIRVFPNREIADAIKWIGEWPKHFAWERKPLGSAEFAQDGVVALYRVWAERKAGEILHESR